jgi:hypothetical protein
MAGRSAELTVSQAVALDKVITARKSYLTGRAELEEELRRQREEAQRALEMNYALAIRDAHELGVPTTQLAERGMGTKNRGTVKVWLEKTARLRRLGMPVGEVFTWVDSERTQVRVSYPDFPTTLASSDYPAVLEGVAVIDHDALNGWSVAEDPGTIQTEAGELVGNFTVEVESVPSSTPQSLTSMLTDWAEANRA